MNIIKNMMDRWDRKKARKNLANKPIHCVFCGKALKTTVQRFLMICHMKKSLDLPTCNACQTLVNKAEATEAESLRLLKKK